MKGPCDYNLMAASRGWERPPANGRQENGSNFSRIAKKILPTTLGSKTSPSVAFRWEHSLGDTLISAMWDPEQRTQESGVWASDLQTAWDDKWVLS